MFHLNHVVKVIIQMEIAEQIVKQEKTLGPITKDKQN